MIFPAMCIAAMAVQGGGAASDRIRTGDTIVLPKPAQAGEISVEATLATRRSIRTYGARPLTMQEVSQLLWAAQGITNRRGFRTAPSAGALYPLEVYLAAGNVAGLPQGLYRYEPQGHRLRVISDRDVRTALAKAALRQMWIKEAPVVLVIAAVYSRTTRKYGGRAERYVHMEVGCVCQNIHLQCESLNLGTCAVGAFSDDAVGRILKEKPKPLLLMPVGARR